ncbi:MAG: class I SAM-dependent methyltransferase [Vicingaceae bacterium]|nr:class I SAM-dependent methyltransferase [Vicingaceae bacterium]
MSNSFTRCLITGNEDLYPLKGYEENYLVKSKSSGFIFCSKIPTEEELFNYYSNYPIGYGADSPLNIKRIKERLDEFEQYRKNNKILDVGCGPGLFLIEAKKRGWEVYGTEFTDKQIEYLTNKGINTFQGKITVSSFEKDNFDVIISSEVIEHINNPIEEISNFNLFLRKGGLLYVTTPNFNSLERFLLKGKYNIIKYPEHLCYFTPKTLNLLLSNNGFKRVKIKTTGISIARIKNSKPNNKNLHSTELENDEYLRESLEYGYKKQLKNLINWILNLLKVGNSMKAYYEKI